MILCLFGALDITERSHSPSVHTRQNPGSANKCLRASTHTDTHTHTHKTHSHACAYPPPHLLTQRHTNKRTASHIRMHAAYKSCNAHTNTLGKQVTSQSFKLKFPTSLLSLHQGTFLKLHFFFPLSPWEIKWSSAGLSKIEKRSHLVFRPVILLSPLIILRGCVSLHVSASLCVWMTLGMCVITPRWCLKPSSIVWSGAFYF